MQAYPHRDTTYLDHLKKLEVALIYVSPAGECLDLCKLSIHIADSLRDTFRLADATNMVANCYKNAGLDDRCLTEYFKALELFEAINDRKWISNLHSNIGTMFMNKGDLDRALKEQQLALKIRQEINYTKSISGLYNALGLVYSKLNQEAEAIKYYNIAVDSSRSESSPYGRGLYLGNIGVACGRLGMHAACVEYNRKALAIHQEMELPQESCRDMHNIGSGYVNWGKLDSAFYYLNKSYSIAETNQYYEVMAASANELKKVYTLKKDFQQALKWANRNMEISDTIFMFKREGENKAMEVAYRVEQKEREDEHQRETAKLQQEADLKRQRILNWSLGIGVVLLGSFGFVVTKRYREKQQANTILEQKVTERTAALRQANENLQNEVAEKEKATKTLGTFLYRSSHDIKGPLTTIKGLVQVGRSENESDPFLEHIGQKVEQLDGVLQQLIDKVELDAHAAAMDAVDITAIVASVRNQVANRDGYAAIQWAEEINISSPLVADEKLLKSIIRQLLNNVIDFRRRDAADNACKISVRGGGSHWRIAIEDRGIGLGDLEAEKAFEMFRRGSNQSRGAGLGLYLAQEASQKLGATLSLERLEQGLVAVLEKTAHS
ncbi:MAG: tetratricopeptide repeat protein [Bacteroidia bacterium]